MDDREIARWEDEGGLVVPQEPTFPPSPTLQRYYEQFNEALASSFNVLRRGERV